MRWLPLVCMLVACPKKTASGPDETEWVETEGSGEEVPELVDSGEWLGSGVSLWVAPGWTGEHTQGPPETLRLSDQESGTELVVELGPTDFGLPRSCEPLFEDAGRYRSVALTELRTASCVEEDGTLVQVWTGRAEYVAVRVSARYPLGSAVKGRQRVEEILPTISPAGGA